MCCGSWGGKESDMTEQLNWDSIKSNYIQEVILEAKKTELDKYLKK